MHSKITVVFMGTPDFSVPVLKMLIENYEVVGVVAQPDKPVGRSGKLGISPVKQVALEYHIPIYQPVKIRKARYHRYLCLWTNYSKRSTRFSEIWMH